MQIHLLSHVDALPGLAKDWQRLSGDIPFRSFEWLTTWWNHYGQNARRELFVIAVRDDNGTVLAIAPCYLQRSLARGREIRLLGDGEVCSDHLSLLCDAQDLHGVAPALADWLTEQQSRWDRILWESVDASDQCVQAFHGALSDRECHVNLVPSGRYWSIDLPKTWDDFLAMQSKSHRKQLRQADRRVLQSDRAKWHLVSNVDELRAAWPIFVDLHQRRRNSLGEPGCFASTLFSAFHQDIAELFLQSGRLRLSWLELDGQPAAAEYHFAGNNSTFAYQGGVDPDRLDEEPGRLSNMATLQAAIAEAHSSFDFLRGDEPYKAHWRAMPHETINFSAIAPRASARLRESAINTAGNMARWFKGGLKGGLSLPSAERES